ncbi:Hypothetical predicted protein [Lecanosticta acicola]|uniref:BRCT domain-containing protein n=1 Tax=Lecanosticta acicola TaxID=111012 RepID=A0AAI9EEW8_9PEZI|nr:Hypothetical predicted protein [Lecanosticta acicola]
MSVSTEIILRISYSTRTEPVEHTLHPAATTQLYFDRDQGLIELRAETDANRLANDIAGKLEARNQVLVFETYARGVVVEPEGRSAARFEADCSVPGRRFVVNLRSGDTVCLGSFGTSFAVLLKTAHPTPAQTDLPETLTTDLLTQPSTQHSTMPPALSEEDGLREEVTVRHEVGPDDETEDESGSVADDPAESISPESPEVPSTSDAAGPGEVAEEAAIRSLQAAESKQFESSIQRPKREAAKRRNAEDTYQVQVDEPLAKRTRHQATSSPAKNRPEESAGETVTPGQATDFVADDEPGVSEDEIVVAQRNVKPWSSSPQHRKPPTPRSTPTSARSQGAAFLNAKKPTVLISGFELDRARAKWLQKQGVTIEGKQIPGKRASFLCVVREDKRQEPEKLPTTIKVLSALNAKKLIVSEAWISDSKKQNELQDPSDYMVANGRDRNRSSLFSGLTMFFTEKASLSGFEGIKTLITDAGVTRIETGTLSKGTSLTPKNRVIFLAEKGDDEGTELVKRLGSNDRVYERSLLTQSILRGELDLDSDEFKIS